jgi:hypothetical protein
MASVLQSKVKAPRAAGAAQMDAPGASWHNGLPATC